MTDMKHQAPAVRVNGTSPRRRHAILAGVALAVAALPAYAQTPGPGVPAVTFPSSQLFLQIGTIFEAGGGGHHGLAVMHNGYLVVPSEPVGSDGAFAFYDVSNPYSPALVNRVTHPNIGEAQTIGFSNGYPGLYAVTNATNGIQFWDWTDVTNPVLVSELVLPGTQPSEYLFPSWWLFWQAPYVYVGAALNGLFIVDATDPADPVIVNHLPLSQIGNFRMAPAIAVGNLLVIGGLDVPGLAVLDISDPALPDPQSALRSIDFARGIYSVIVNGDKIYAATVPPNPSLAVWDIRDPTRLDFLDAVSIIDRGGYLTYQDGFVHVGASMQGFYKIDARNPAALTVAGHGDAFGVPSADTDFVSVIGNFVVVGDDDGTGTRIFPHQELPDTTPPRVNMVNPKTNAVAQAATTRVGLTFTDQIDLRSVTPETFVVRPVGGAGLPGKYSGQLGVVNFWPDQPLVLDVTYEVEVPAGGIRDLAGNAIDQTFTSRFSTGAVAPPSCTIVPNPPSLVGEQVPFDVACEPGWRLYSWNFGDGTDPTPLSADPAVSHAYAEPGHYLALLTVHEQGTVRTLNTRQTVAYPVTPTRPTHAASITFDPARQRVWNVNPDNDTLTAIDAVTLTKLLEEPVGRHPATVALAPDGALWVTNKDDATLSIVNGGTGQTLMTLPLPYASRPHGVAFSPAGDAAYVTLEATGRLVSIDLGTLAVIDDVNVGPRPRGIAVSHDGQRVLVTRFISPADHGEVVEVDAAAFTVARTFELALDPGPDSDSSGRGVPNYLLSITISPDGRRAWVPSKKDNTVRGLYVSGEPLTFETTVRTIVSQLDLLANAEDLAARIDIDNSALASAVVFNPLGDYAFVCTLGSNTIEVLDAYTGEGIAALEDVGLSPQGLALNPDATRLFVHNYMSRSVAVFDVSNVDQGGQIPLLAEIPTVASEKLPPQVLFGKQIFYNAADPRMSRDKYLSCAICHLDGDSDERVWDFTDRGEGVRNTVVLQGRSGIAHGPVHWSANFDEIQDFEHDIRGEFEGFGFMADEDFNQGTRNTPLGDPKKGVSPELDALAAFLRSLNKVHASPFRNPDGTMTADAIAGAVIFRSPNLGCTKCHRGSQFTDSDLYNVPFLLNNVGTITPASGSRLGGPLPGIDNPTLKGIWETAPYFHDGSAQTLMDVITSNPSKEHALVTRILTPTQREQLVAYMLQIDNTAPTDFDGDLDADLDDFGFFQNCLTGPNQGPPAPRCGPADLDLDGDVDQDDFGVFQLCTTLPNVPADPNCAD